MLYYVESCCCGSYCLWGLDPKYWPSTISCYLCNPLKSTTVGTWVWSLAACEVKQETLPIWKHIINNTVAAHLLYSMKCECLVRIHKGFFSRFFEQEQQHCTASAYLQKFCFDKHASFERKKKKRWCPFLFWSTLTSKRSTWFFNFCLKITTVQL